MSTFITILLIIGGIALFFLVIFLILILMGLIAKKSMYYEQLTRESADIIRTRSRNLTDKIATTNQLLELCQKLISIEITNRIKNLIMLRQKYPLERLDTDIQAISTSVFQAINFDAIDQTLLCVTRDYVMRNIAEITTVQLLSSIQDLNQMIAE